MMGLEKHVSSKDPSLVQKSIVQAGSPTTTREREASRRLASLHAMDSQTARRYTAPQRGYTRDKV